MSISVRALLLLHSKIYYLNSLVLNLPATQTNRLQLALNSAARAVTKTPKFHHITPFLKSLDWHKINGRIKCKVLSVTISHINLSNWSTFLPPLSSFISFASTHVVGTQLCRLSPFNAHTVSLKPLMGRYLDIIHDFVLCHFAMCTSVNCLTYILGMMLNCIRNIGCVGSGWYWLRR